MSDEQPKFANVAAFVEDYIGNVYQRQVTDLSDTVWCQEWWRHVEAVARLDALWRAWEQLHRDERGGLSHWLLEHADHHMKRLFDPRGPFKYCSVRNGHMDMIGPLPLKSPPGGLFVDEDDERPEGWIYRTVVEFVENYLSMIYQRQVTDLSDTVWCPEWWRHQEAVVRLDALWRAWEYHRQNPSTGLSMWFLKHADPHMAQLFDPKGPFKYCNARGGHQSNLSPLPITLPVQGLFTDPEDPR
ncbi:DUF4913 domain-containing protein [Nocardia sp. NPDC050710]|uniref:DUF4913 domain-containing protein n=1 Tax=Nocardia sp. NPDC050710 TaxID=3157220 RepID=UPI0033C5961D